jgi:hypothetical protein
VAINLARQIEASQSSQTTASCLLPLGLYLRNWKTSKPRAIASVATTSGPRDTNVSRSDFFILENNGEEEEE